MFVSRIPTDRLKEILESKFSFFSPVLYIIHSKSRTRELLIFLSVSTPSRPEREGPQSTKYVYYLW